MKIIKKFLAVISSAVICAVASIPITSSAIAVDYFDGSFDSILSELGENTYYYIHEYNFTSCMLTITEEGKVAHYETGKPKIVVTPKEGVDFPLDEINQELDSYGFKLNNQLELNEDGSYYIVTVSYERDAACEIISSYDEVQSIDITYQIGCWDDWLVEIDGLRFPDEYDLERVNTEYPEFDLVESTSTASEGYVYYEFQSIIFGDVSTDIYNAFMRLDSSGIDYGVGYGIKEVEATETTSATTNVYTAEDEAEETEADYKLLYTVEQDGTATITGYEGVVETLVIPSEIDGYPVSKIDVQAFATSGEELYNDENSYCSVETLIIEEGVTEIELEAFLNCKNLKSVTLPNTLDYVWDMAFCGCDSLKEIKIPSGTGRICEAAFGYKYECNYVDGVYDYEAWTEKMDDFTIYGEVDSIAETYASENGFTFIALDDTSSGTISNLLTWEISSDYNTLLVTVGDDYTMTFQDNTCYVDGTVIETTSSWNIEELDTEENQEFIEWLSEFELNEIIFSDNVTEIIDTFNIYLFNQAEKIAFGENVAIIGDGVFYSSEASEIVFPDSLIEIGDNAFENCTNLSSIILPKNINSVGESAFHACSSLLDVTVLSQNADLADHCFGYSNQIEPLENMIIRGYAGSTAETYASENGFTFIALDDVTTETTTFTLGDVDENNIIDAIDASYVLSEYAKKATSQASGFTESQEFAADVNGDSVVDAVDASFILSYYAYTAVGGMDSFEDYMTTH